MDVKYGALEQRTDDRNGEAFIDSDACRSCTAEDQVMLHKDDKVLSRKSRSFMTDFADR